MDIPRSIIKNWVKNLDGYCLFHACEGSRNPPLDMMTCVICYSVWEMKQYMYGLTRKQIDQKRIQYQKKFDKKRSKSSKKKENLDRNTLTGLHWRYK
jgi:hypothetical protein